MSMEAVTCVPTKNQVVYINDKCLIFTCVPTNNGVVYFNEESKFYLIYTR